MISYSPQLGMSDGDEYSFTTARLKASVCQVALVMLSLPILI